MGVVVWPMVELGADDRLRWLGPTSDFESFTIKVKQPKLLERANLVAARVIHP